MAVEKEAALHVHRSIARLGESAAMSKFRKCENHSIIFADYQVFIPMMVCTDSVKK
jgi:hypothetical protein